MSLLEEFEKSTESFIKYGKIYDLETLKKGLTILPYVIEQASIEAVKKDSNKKRIANEKKRIEAKIKMEAVRLKEAKELTSAQDRDGWVQTHPELKEIDDKLIAAEEEAALAKIHADRLKDNLATFQKLTSESMNSNYLIDKSQRYVG